MTTVPLNWTDAPTTARPRTRAVSLVILCLVAASLFGRLCYLAKPFDHDARLFIYLGKLVETGGRFGHDMTDNKFPTVGLMTSVFYRAFGVHWPAYVISQTVLMLGAVAMLWRTCARHVSRDAANCAALTALVLLNFSPAVFGGFQLESLQIVFAVLSACAAIEALFGRNLRDAFLVGLAGGCAMMLKPSGGAVLLAFAIATIVRNLRQPLQILSQGLASACGFAIPVAVTLIYLVHTDTLRDIPALYHQIAQYAAHTPVTIVDWIKPVAVVILLALPALIRWRAFTGQRDANLPRVDRSTLVFASLWLILELLGAIAQRRMNAYHFLPVAAPAAFLYGLLPRRDSTIPQSVALVPIAILSLIGGLVIVRNYAGAPARMPVSDYIQARTTPTDSVWQDSTCRLLLETDRQPGCRIPLTYLFFNTDTSPQELSAVMLADFEIRKPKYITLDHDLDAFINRQGWQQQSEPELIVRRTNYRKALRSILDYVQSHYRVETQLDGQTIYRRMNNSR